MKAVNLLPSDRSPSPGAPAKAAGPSGDAWGAYVLLGALALAVVGIAALVLVGNTIKDRKADLARVNNEAQATQVKAAALAPYAEFATLAVNRVTTVTDLAHSRFDWERALRDLSKAIPSNVHLKSLKGTVSSGAGSSGNALRGAIQSPAIELSGCTVNQKSVASLMSRLRAVRGVTRVSLLKSDKGDAQLAPQVAGATDTQAILCKGNPPSFELVMFFERAAIPAGALPTSGASAPGTAQPGGSGTPSQPVKPTDPGTPAGSTSQPTTPSGTQPAPATQGVSTP